MADSNYCIEQIGTAREEVLFRIKHRDAWFKLQLLAQAVLWALAQGIKFSGIESTAPFPEAIFLAPPISLVFASLYYVEDGLIHKLNKYIKRKDPGSWDGSPELQEYAKGLTLILRVVAQLAAFVVLPLYLLREEASAFSYVLMAVTIVVIMLGYVQRRTTASNAK